MAEVNPEAGANRLIHSTSPYLLQHAHNPVDWYPWGAEAIARAKAEQKPLFLSIGYSACHWCHVMEKEVFEQPAIAALMNEHFINIKVDREERPDLDEVYMLATQIMTGSGGWPMSVWLTPDLKPFYAGTYFPPVDAYGRPGFPRIELALAAAWKDQREAMIAQAEKVAAAVADHANDVRNTAPGEIRLKEWLAAAIEDAADRFDPKFGGLGSAPKFPPSQALLLWVTLLHAQGGDQAVERLGLLDAEQMQTVRQMAVKTLDGMARGGIYDQVAGGFARYSTDQYWLVPHFEKMLYDNAQLAAVYAIASRALGGELYRRITRQTLDFWLREMTAANGAFYSTLDADSEGHEGKFYVWTEAEIRAVFPDPKEAALIIEHLGVTAQGNWEETNVLFANVTVDELAHQHSTTADAMQKHLDKLLLRLRETRAQRIPPALDDKVLTSWNGLMISGLAVAGHLLREPRYLEAAHRAIGFILLQHTVGGKTLLRVSRNGAAHTEGFLEDHAYLLNGLLDLIDSTTPTSLPGTMARKRALELADTMLALFRDPVSGTFFFSHGRHDQLFARLTHAGDNATPSANGVAIRALLRLAQVSGKTEYRDRALEAVRAFSTAIDRHPGQYSTVLLALVEDHIVRANNPHLGSPVQSVLTLGQTAEIAIGDSAVANSSRIGIEALGPMHVPPGGRFEIPLVIRITDGFHIQPHAPVEKESFATIARLRTDLPLEGERWHYPAPEMIQADGHEIHGYQKQVTFTAYCHISPTARPGSYTIRATVLTQVCSNTACYPPERLTIEIPVTVAP